MGSTEVGGFGISSHDDLLLVEDFVLIEQWSTSVTVEFNDNAVAEFFEDQVDAGRTPEQFARIWIHTHPGACPRPSGTDEATFGRCFGTPDWAVMFILACGGATYSRLRFNVGPTTSKRLDVAIDYESEFEAADHFGWTKEYEAAVSFRDPFTHRRSQDSLIESQSIGNEPSHCDPYWLESEWVAS